MPEADTDAGMLEEYDFSGGRRGVYAERYAQGTNLDAALVRAARRTVKPQPRKEREAAQ